MLVNHSDVTIHLLRNVAMEIVMSPKYPVNSDFKCAVVQLILNRQTEQALELLAKEYHVEIPKLCVGLPKGHIRNAYGTYNAKNQTICVMNSDIFSNPFVILHEFYHHLRSKGVDKRHRGTEKNANLFAIEFLKNYEVNGKTAQKDSSSC
jgi:Zn-dependent peptidase ImmA (M78 family)